MSFNEMSLTELRSLCKTMGIEVDAKLKKPEVINELQDNGVTWNYVKELQQNLDNNKPDESELEQKKKLKEVQADMQYDGEQKLLKMISQNASLEIMGFKFTRVSPFNVMGADDAQKIIDFYPDKFRLAHPREAQEFYA